MLFLMIDLLVLAAVTAAALTACAHVMEAGAGEDWPVPGIDYGLLHAHWREQEQVRDWASLHDQVRRWHAVAAPGCAAAVTEQVARDLNAAVFRFAVPGEAPAFGFAAAPVRDGRRRPATRRARGVRWPF